MPVQLKTHAWQHASKIVANVRQATHKRLLIIFQTNKKQFDSACCGRAKLENSFMHSWDTLAPGVDDLITLCCQVTSITSCGGSHNCCDGPTSWRCNEPYSGGSSTQPSCGIFADQEIESMLQVNSYGYGGATKQEARKNVSCAAMCPMYNKRYKWHCICDSATANSNLPKEAVITREKGDGYCEIWPENTC